MAGRRAGPALAGSPHEEHEEIVKRPWRDEAVDRFVRLRPAVLARMRASVPAELRAEFEAITGRQLQALSALPEAGLTMRELASALGVSGATASVLSDRLVTQGLAARGADPVDRRIVRLAPTASGAALTARYREAQRQAVAALLGSLTDEQVASWLDIMQTLAGEDTETTAQLAEQMGEAL
jgi:DNA-binding MarR family transcriptional regulator